MSEVDQWALEAVEPTEHLSRDPPAEECAVCGGEADPIPYDAVPVETPEGRVYLRIGDDGSCLSCRRDTVRKLSRRGLDQEALSGWSA